MFVPRCFRVTARLSALLASLTGFALPAVAAEVGIVSWGGNYQEAQRQAYFRPFEKDSGIKVVDGVGPQIERSRAEVLSGKPGYDVAVTNQSFNLIGIDQNLWVPIDYRHFAPADLEGIPQEMRQKYGVGSIVYSEGLIFSTKAFPAADKEPKTYADVWDVKRFPGKRAFPWCDVASFPLPEAALLADGVPMDQLYPLDIERAARKLKQLAPDVVWWRDINQAGQLVATGEASIAISASGRAQVLIDGGAPLKIQWNQNRYTFDVWYVLRGAPNVAEAMKFIAYASRPEPQAAMAKAAGYAPTNKRALALLDEKTASKMPTHPDNLRVQFRKDENWWKVNRDKWVQTCKAALL